MNCRARLLLVALSFSVFAARIAVAQVVMQPTPNPTVTAEHEPWYQNGDPITHAGHLYYPAGPRVYFNANEMVRSGFHMGIPLYSRTTIEPHSVVYLPVGPGLLQPYERPRIGTLAETSGSLASSLRAMPRSEAVGLRTLEAAGPPSQTTTVIPVQVPLSRAVGTTGAESAANAAGADRAADPRRRAEAPRRPMHTRIGGVPQGSNSIYIQFEGDRWYKAGPAESIDTDAMSRTGTHAGVPVWTAPGGRDGIIYVPVTQDGGSLAVPYSRKR